MPATFDATPSVLLEQEDWFETEIGFVRRYLKPGMKVIDIGANFGIYTLNAARCVGRARHVWAFEPAPNTRRFLAASVKANSFENVSVDAHAVSDSIGETWIALHWNPELNSLVDGPDAGGNTERIKITTLDALAKLNPGVGEGDGPDFIKMDAEGHERQVLAGGRRLLAGCSPLVMFEIKHGEVINSELIRDLEAQGFGIYRLVPGLDLLQRFVPSEGVDPYELNLFACKPALARKLSLAGLLAEKVLPLTDREQLSRAIGVDAWTELLATLPCFIGVATRWLAAVAESRRFGLAGCAAALLRSELSAADRLALLQDALALALQACAEIPRPSRLHTLARIAWMLGKRDVAVQALRRALWEIDNQAHLELDEAFLPALPEFDSNTIEEPRTWFEAATITRLLQPYSFSGYFAKPEEEMHLLDRAARLPYFSPALARRRQLARIRAGLQGGPECTSHLAEFGPDNLNHDFWCRPASRV